MAEDKPGMLAGIRMNYRMTKQTYPRLGLILLGTFVLGLLVGLALFYLLPGDGLISTILTVVGGVLFGFVAVSLVMARMSQKAMYAQIEGTLGAAGRAMQMLRRGWKVDAPIAFNKNQDLVHRVVGPPGIVLVGEGNPNRLKPLLASERRKHERVTSETPIQEIVVGYHEGEVPLSKLVRHIQKLKRRIKPAEMTDVLARLRALDAQRSPVPIPKGPVPTSMKGFRGNLRGR